MGISSTWRRTLLSNRRKEGGQTRPPPTTTLPRTPTRPPRKWTPEPYLTDDQRRHPLRPVHFEDQELEQVKMQVMLVSQVPLVRPSAPSNRVESTLGPRGREVRDTGEGREVGRAGAPESSPGPESRKNSRGFQPVVSDTGPVPDLLNEPSPDPFLSPSVPRMWGRRLLPVKVPTFPDTETGYGVPGYE